VSASKKLIAILAGSLALLVVPSAASADTTITVDTSGDGAAGCTLRNAIESADTETGVGTCPAGTGNDTVVIPGTVASPINLNSELAAGGIGTLNINGPGVGAMTVSGQNAVRVLRVEGPVAVTNLTIANGAVLAATGATGGGVNVDAAGSVTLDHTRVTGNAVGAAGAAGSAAAFGGGIFADGHLTVIDSTVDANSVVALQSGTTGADSALAEGGGIMATGTSGVNVFRSTLNGNGAAASAPAGSAGSFAVGGGIAVGGNGANATSVIASTVSENAVQALGTAGAPSSGGGIFSVATGGTTLTNDTLTANTGQVGANLSGSGASLGNVLLSAPTGGANCNAAVTSAGYNLEDADSCGLTQPTDKINQGFTGLDPNLASNGGPTQTHALLNTGPAIDAGNSFGLNVDQRGFTRPVDFSGIPNAAGGDGTDIGAFEIQKDCPGQITPGGPCKANMQTSPSVLNFGDVTVGTASAAQTVTVSNTGTADLTLSGSVFGGPSPGDYEKTSDGCGSATLVPGASCTIGILFRPTAVDQRTATLIVSGNGPTPTSTVTLRGDGLAPATTAPPPPSSTPPIEPKKKKKCKKRKGKKKAAVAKKCKKKEKKK
jgi:hypothetical protein